MRHKYETRGVVLSRAPLGEASAFITLITPELGTVRAHTQSVRRSGAKLAHALTTFAESEVVLVRGKEGWRLSGAVLQTNWFARLSPLSRERAVRISGLLQRLVTGEAPEPALFPIMTGFFESLSNVPHDLHEAAEILAALRILSTLGFDAEQIPQESDFTLLSLETVRAERTAYIARINQGIAASGL